MPYLNDILVEVGDDEFNVTTDWVEAGSMSNQQPGGGDNVTPESSEYTIVIEFAPNKIRSAYRKILGFAYADSPDLGAAARLHRENPLPHPRHPNARAVSMSVSQFAPDASGGTQKADAIVLDGGPPFPIRYYQKWQRAYATVRFRPLRWRCLEDSDIAANTDEIDRNVFWDPGSSIEMLSAEGPLGQMQWNETDGPPKAFGPTIGDKLKQAFGTLVSKGIYTMAWMRVPHEWITSTEYPLPVFTNLLNCVGKTNSSTFAGFLAHTLLMQPPKFVPYQWPISTNSASLGFYGWDVYIPFQQFNPANGFPASTKRGYQLLPWAPQLLWYEAVRSAPGPLGTTHLLPTANFNTIFERPS